MWWNGQGWPHMYGVWWVMPFLGMIFMLIFLYFILRVIGGKGCCGSDLQGSNQHNGELEELKEEIKKLRNEVEKLRNSADHK